MVLLANGDWDSRSARETVPPEHGIITLAPGVEKTQRTLSHDNSHSKQR